MDVALILVAFTISIIGFYISELRRPKNYAPGPYWLPFVENYNDIKKLCIQYGGLHLAFLKLSEQFKTNILGLKLGGEYVVVVSSYSLVRTVLLTDTFEGKPNSFFLRTRCMGALRGIFCVDGPLWTEQRNFLVRRLRNAGYGKKSTECLINKELDGILQALETAGPDVEFEPVFAPPILNIIWILLTGISIWKEDPRLQNVLSMLNRRGKAFDMAGGMLNQFPWLRYLIPERIGYNLLVTLNKELEELFKDTIRRYQNTWQPGRRDNLIYSFLSERQRCEEKKKTFTDEQLIIVFLDLFLGATQTSGATISFILLMMLLHPDVQAKAFEEINESLDPNTPLYYKDRVKVPYIEAIILEVSRLYPIAALAAPRRALRATVLDGYTVPEGSTVYANLYAVHHDDAHWHDPEVFRPERFLDGNGNVQSSDRILSFGLGKRRCLGELLARQCVFIFFVGILRKYQICPVPNTVLPSTKPTTGIFLSPQKYKARLIRRACVD